LMRRKGEKKSEGKRLGAADHKRKAQKEGRFFIKKERGVCQKDAAGNILVLEGGEKKAGVDQRRVFRSSVKKKRSEIRVGSQGKKRRRGDRGKPASRIDTGNKRRKGNTLQEKQDNTEINLLDELFGKRERAKKKRKRNLLVIQKNNLPSKRAA